MFVVYYLRAKVAKILHTCKKKERKVWYLNIFS